MGYALITGASAGIGRIFALELAKTGNYDLILTARRKDRLEELRAGIELDFGSRCIVVQADLSSEQGVSQVREVIQTEEVSLLINNAGFGGVGPFAKLDSGAQSEMVKLNCLAPVELSGEFIRRAALRASPSFLINVASTAAFQPLPLMATYAASKSFLLSFTLAVSEELRGSPIRAIALCPGPTKTEFHLVSGLPEKIDLLPAMTAEEVVKRALLGMARGERCIVTGRFNRFVSLLGSLLPYALVLPLVRRSLEPKLNKKIDG